MMITGCTGGEEFTPEKSKIVEGKFAPKLSVKARYKLADGKPFEKDLNVDHFWTSPSSGDTKQIQPDLDCGIYPDENELFLPTNNNTKMPEQPDLQKIHDAIYPAGSSRSHYMHVIPNSHFWTDLTQIRYSIDHELEKQKRKLEVKGNNTIYVGEPLDREYILVGLNNSIKNGYELKQDKNVKLNPADFIIFQSIKSMIEYVESERFNLKGFSSIISNTINVGLNLTNGLKMERKEIYKRLDGQRDYQDITWVARRTANGTPDEEKSISEWLTYMEHHLNKVKEAIYYLKDDEALAEIRKVTALGVRAMEIHGCPERKIPVSVTINVKDDNCDSKK